MALQALFLVGGGAMGSVRGNTPHWDLLLLELDFDAVKRSTPHRCSVIVRWK